MRTSGSYAIGGVDARLPDGPPLSSGVLRRAAPLVIVVTFSTVARAHIGAIVTPAQITSPPRLPSTPSQVMIPTADASFTISWTDGDIDPTGRYYFYYLDHQPPGILHVEDAEKQATIIPEGSNGIWASCSCAALFDCVDSGVRDCRNSFTWDTSGVAAGTYWIIASDVDPPYHAYTVSETPVRIGHGGGEPGPAAVVLRPNGIGSADNSYRLQWIAVGQGPLHFDLLFGSDSYPGVLGPRTSIGMDVTAMDNGDGTWGYLWDPSNVVQMDIFVEVRVTDAMGRSAFTDSNGLTIAHPMRRDAAVDLAPAPAPRDLALPLPPSSSCESEPGAPGAAALPGLALAAVAAMLLWIRMARRS
jgi:hypothetical protein